MGIRAAQQSLTLINNKKKKPELLDLGVISMKTAIALPLEVPDWLAEEHCTNKQAPYEWNYYLHVSSV